mgnify:CR=1 FL=1
MWGFTMDIENVCVFACIMDRETSLKNRLQEARNNIRLQLR